MCSLVKWSFDTNVFGLSVEYQEGGILRANTSLEPKAFEEHVYQKLGIKIAYSARPLAVLRHPA